MIIVDNALRAREADGRPIRVGLLGAGFMAQGLANQIRNSVPGMEVVAVYGRKPDKAVEVFRYAGAEDSVVVDDLSGFEDAVRSGRSPTSSSTPSPSALAIRRSSRIETLPVPDSSWAM